MKKKEFLKIARKDLRDNGIKVIFKEPQQLRNCGGYFDWQAKTLVVGKHESWFEIFLHEYCHFKQYHEKSSIIKYSWVARSALIEWYSYEKDFPDYVKRECFYITRDIELNCEKRVVQMIKKYDLPINIDEYIKGANLHMYLYKYSELMRVKIPIFSYHKYNLLEDMMPTKFLTKRQYNRMPPKVFNHFLIYSK